MKCIYPLAVFDKKTIAPCGQCMPCRINKRRSWTSRMLMEQAITVKAGKQSAFITLTYSEANVPKDADGYNILVKKDLQDFLKRFRYYMSLLGSKIRFFAVGEYGDRTWRPHFHLIVYGMSPTDLEHKLALHKAWPFGMIKIGTTTSDSVQYCAQYCVKKLTSEKDKRLLGRPPEFTTMSRNPGLGFFFIPDLIGSVLKNKIKELKHVRFGSKIYPITRYIREKVYNILKRCDADFAFDAGQDTLAERLNSAISTFIQRYGIRRWWQLRERGNFANYVYLGQYVDVSDDVLALDQYMQKHQYNRRKL